MRRLGKTDTLPIRFHPDQLRRIRRAAKLESADRREPVAPSTLFRELGMRAVDEFLTARLPRVA